FFCRLKHFRAVATRYDKRASSYLATLHLAAIVLVL
ncbi:MAG: transposase, partial [Anaerolineae bacterium]|nr:transposase [Anaerolineae bacterium]